MGKCAGALFLVGLMTSLTWAQSQVASDTAGFDAQGNIYVSSDDGRHIIVGNTARCSEALGSPNRQTMACSVREEPQSGNLMPSRRLEIYSRGGIKRTVAPGAPIHEWHFWHNGQQVVIFFGEIGGKGTYGLYDSVTGSMVQQLAEPADESLLPQWAKDSFQIARESVPTGPQFKEERTKWIAKTLYQIGKLQPGMRRKDVLKILTEEGGLSTRLQKTYVSPECPFIKVDISFKAVNDTGDLGKEDPEDVVESVSRPYLAWSVLD